MPFGGGPLIGSGLLSSGCGTEEGRSVLAVNVTKWRQVSESPQAKETKEVGRGAVLKWIANGGKTGDRFDEFSRMQGGEYPGSIHAADGLDFGSRHGLLIGDDRQRFKRGRREFAFTLETEEVTDIACESWCRCKVKRRSMALHNPASRRVVVELGEGRLNARRLYLGHLGERRRLWAAR